MTLNANAATLSDLDVLDVRSLPVSKSRAKGILIVEDDPDAQWTLARSLTVRGNRVVGASSAESAIALISAWPVDLVMLDDELPGMSGLELVREIRNVYPNIAVVFMSKNDSEELRSLAKAAGAVACLSKPLQMSQVDRLVRQILS